MWSKLRNTVVKSKHDKSCCLEYHKELLEGRITDGVCTKDGIREKLLESHTMAFPNLDKCSCGSPRPRKITDGKSSLRTTDSLRKKGDIVAEINRKNVEMDRRGFCGTAQNEYTKPEVLQHEDRQWKKRTTHPGQTISSKTIESHQKDLLQDSNNYASVSSSKRQTKSDDEDDDDDDDDYVFDDKQKTFGKKKKNGCSDYTALAYDVNYVKVSPPKLTRRPKRSSEDSEGETRMSRGSMLLASKNAEHSRHQSSSDADNPDGSKEVNILEVPARKIKELPDLLESRGRENDRDPQKTDTESDFQVNETSKLFPSLQGKGPISETASFSESTADYISWQDLQDQQQQQSRRKSLDSKLEPQLSRDDSLPTSSSHALALLDGKPRLDGEDQQMDEIAIVQDGDRSFLEFTFTIRLENNSVTRSGNEIDSGRAEASSATSDSQQTDTISMLKPIITVGIRSVATALENSGMKIESSGNVESRERQKSLPFNDDKSSSDTVKNVATHLKSSIVRDERVSGKESREATDLESNKVTNRNSNRVYEANQKYGTTPPCRDSIGNKQLKDGMARAYETTDKFDKDPKIPAKKQTLAEFMSNSKSKITTVAIVHHPADFGEEKLRLESQRNKSLFANVRDAFNTHMSNMMSEGNGDRCFNIDNTGESELTHMNWDEVMKEAKALGIPLNRPAQKQQQTGNNHEKRRSSICSLIEENCSPSANSNKMATSWACPNCAKDNPRQPVGVGARASPPTKKNSPFKERFKLSNFFCKRFCGKDEDRQSKSKNGVGGTSKSNKSNSCDHSPCRHLVKSPGKVDSVTSPNRCNGNGTSKQTEDQTLLIGNRLHHHGTIQSTARPSNKEESNEISPKKNQTTARNSSTLDFLKSLEQLKNCGWYWGPIGFEEAEQRLAGQPDGAFLVRDSSDDRYILSLSFRSQGATHHTRIEHFKGKFSFFSQQSTHEASTIVEFIENAVRYSNEGRCLYYLRPRSSTTPPTPVQLLYPVSRFASAGGGLGSSVPSLSYLSMMSVLRHVQRSSIDRLPLSTTVKDSLKKQQLRLHQHLQDNRLK